MAVPFSLGLAHGTKPVVGGGLGRSRNGSRGDKSTRYDRVLRANANTSSSSSPESLAKETKRLCKRCKHMYFESENDGRSCRFHPLDWSGGEKAKAIGFLRKSDDPEHSLASVHGTGMMHFWDCCGADQYDSPGCAFGPHIPYD